jgi:hypothetical protein
VTALSCFRLGSAVSRFFKWINENKSWLFSGIGVVVLGLLWSAVGLLWNFLDHRTMPPALTPSNPSAAVKSARPIDPRRDYQLSPATQPPITSPIARQAGRGAGDVQPALHLGDQRWTFTVDGLPLSIEFGSALDQPTTLSSDRFGSKGRWTATGSVSFQVVTDTHVMQGWFELNGNAQITGCGGFVTQRGGGQSYSITACKPEE